MRTWIKNFLMNALLGLIGYIINVFINLYWLNNIGLALIIETPKLFYGWAGLFAWHFIWKYGKKLKQRYKKNG